MSLANVMGRRICGRKTRICREIAEEGKNVAESAEECMASVQSLVRRRQLTLNPINSEVAKVSKVIKFEGNSYFFTWNRDALAATTEVGIPLANRGSYIKTLLKGDALSRVNAELATVSHPTMEEVFEVL